MTFYDGFEIDTSQYSNSDDTIRVIVSDDNVEIWQGKVCLHSKKEIHWSDFVRIISRLHRNGETALGSITIERK